MRKTGLNSIIGIMIILIIVLIVIIWYKNIKPSVTDRNITVNAVLELNNTDVNDYKEYLLSISMTKHKDCNIAVYPYIDGLGQMAFSEKDKEEYYVPGSVGSHGVSETIAIKELKKKNIIDNGKDVSLIGFWFPDNAGLYKARVYLSKLDNFKAVKNPVLVCVYSEKKYGKELAWAKTVPIIIR